MRRLRALLLRLIGAFSPRRDFDAELESHLALHIDDNVRAGMSPEAARRAALIKLGGVTQTREAYGARRGLPIVEHLAQDVRFALRTLRKSPGFTVIVILTLALGIGANAAMFSIIDAVLLRPFAYPDPDQLMVVWATSDASCQQRCEASFLQFEDWKAQNHSFSSLSAHTMYDLTIATGDHAERLAGIQMTPGFFEMLGVAPALGRTFQAGDEPPGARVCILSDESWRVDFGARPDIIGRAITLNEQPYTVIGVLRPDFDFTDRHGDQREIYTPLARDADRGHRTLQVLGRLRFGVSIHQAQADMDVITARLAAQYPASDRRIGTNVSPLAYAYVGRFRQRLWILMGVVAMVLLIASTNVANLLLARNLSRERELAVRAALGAGRARLLQQLLTESLVLAIAGGAIGLLLASWLGPALAAMLAMLARFPITRAEQTHVNASVFAFTFGVSLLTVVLFGVVHAQGTAGNTDLQESLRSSGRATGEGPRGTRLRRLLVITQVALALVLLAGAGALLRSLLVITATPIGLVADHLLTIDFVTPKMKFADSTFRVRYFQDLLARAQAMPQVESAAIASDPPFGHSLWHVQFALGGGGGAVEKAKINSVSADYFKTLRIPVKAGRVFGPEDTPNATAVIVINETAARRFWPNIDPIGQQVIFEPAAGGTPVTVVGVTRDVHDLGLAEEVMPEFYVSCLQPALHIAWWNTLVVRTTIYPATLARSLKAAAVALDPDVPFMRAQTMDSLVAKDLASPRVYTSMLAAFAGLALLLATIGLYGVMSYIVTQRVPELAIRLALGAQRRDIVQLVLRQAVVLTVTGTMIGLTAAFIANRLLTQLIPTVDPNDPLTLTTVSALLFLAACGAGFMPAWRGSRVDPLASIRQS